MKVTLSKADAKLYITSLQKSFNGYMLQIYYLLQISLPLCLPSK